MFSESTYSLFWISICDLCKRIAEATIGVPIETSMHSSFPSQLIWAYHVRKFEDTNMTIRSSISKGRQHDGENNERQSNATKTQDWATGNPTVGELTCSWGIPSGAHRVTVKRHEINDSSNNAQLTYLKSWKQTGRGTIASLLYIRINCGWIFYFNKCMKMWNVC